MKRGVFRRNFGRELAALVFPIVIQNLISCSVQLADTVMLGRVSQTALSASSLAGQVGFILNIIFFGLNSALTILASQYWGKKDTDTVGRIFGIGLCFAAIISFLITAVSAAALVINVTLNAILIFGLLGFAKLGIIGAAIATVISRFAELIICVRDFYRQNILSRNIASFFRVPKTLLNDFRRYGLPAIFNDVLWVFAFNMNSVIMGHLGSDAVAASSVVAVARDLVTVTGFGISSAAAIMLGKEIGEGNHAQAKSDASAILLVTVAVTVVQGLVLYSLRYPIADMVILTDTARRYLIYMLTISCVYQSFQVLNTMLIASILRCGGDIRFGIRLDIIAMWFVTVPLGILTAFVLRLPPLTVYTCLCIDELFKFPLN